MESWAVQLAGELKKRDNPSILGPLLGIVLSPPPALKISILDGKVFVTEIYILSSLLEQYERNLTMPIESVQGELTLQEYVATREDGEVLPPHEYKINLFEIQKKKIVTEDTLKKGDTVLLLSSNDNQKYFCLGRVTRLGG